MAATNKTNTWSSLALQLEELRDPRCDGWWMMSSLWPTILLSTSYYIIVRHAGPSFMKNRSAYNLLINQSVLITIVTSSK